MSEDAKRTGGAPAAKPTSDDRRISSGSAPFPTGTKVTIKSADMKPDVQKEAVDIAIAVCILSDYNHRVCLFAYVFFSDLYCYNL